MVFTKKPKPKKLKIIQVSSWYTFSLGILQDKDII